MQRLLWVGICAWLAACGGPSTASDAGTSDAGTDARATQCASANECRGADECTTYDCRPGDPAADARGCVVEPMCTAEQTCRAGACVRACTPAEADRDGDGADNPECGGNDCNDDDNTVNPNRTEVCDAAGVDEDCNPSTIRGPDAREGDADNDTLISSACWNVRPDGTENRGPDCDDTLPGSQLGTVDHCSACGNACQFRCDAGTCTGLGQVSVGASHVCALDGGGELYCWGHNSDGELGDDSIAPALRPRRASVIARADEVAVGLAHTCARINRGVRCWGGNGFGQLGNASTLPSRTPVSAQLPRVGLELIEIHQLAAGGFATAIIGGADRRLYCWGTASHCGLAPSGSRSTPTLVDSALLTNLRQIAMGGSHGCALTMTGEVYCFGSNRFGQLAVARSNPGPAPVGPVSTVAPAVMLAAGAAHTCALLGDGSVWCWGSNRAGMLGDALTSHETCGSAAVGDLGDCSPAPVQVASIANAIAIAPGCALLGSGEVRCWAGTGAAGSIGVPAPMIVLGGAAGTGGALGGESAGTHCGVVSNESLWCWGDNAVGQAGNGTTTTPASPGRVLTPE